MSTSSSENSEEVSSINRPPDLACQGAMKLGLFGKILIAFWLTLVALGFVLMLLFGSFSTEERTAARWGPSFLLMLEHTLEREGVQAAERKRLLIEPPVRDRITIALETEGDGSATGESATLRRAIAPDQRSFVLRYTRDPFGRASQVPTFAVWGGLVAGLIFSIALAGYLSRPLRLLRNGFERLAQGDLDVRLATRVGRRGDEIADLARDFDLMAERLEQLVTARDRLLNDVSHELRSPLTRLQLAIALARQDPARTEASLVRIEQEADRLDLLVPELLTLARAESGKGAFDDYFDPIAVMADVVADNMIEAQAKDCKIDWVAPAVAEEERPVMAGSAELFRRAIENVLRNAMRFSPAGTAVKVGAEILAGPPRYRIQVLDEGPGVPPDLADKLFDPFVRGEHGGTGLGLAIASRAIQAHGGIIKGSNRQAGGLAVEIEVPAQLPEG